MKIKRLSVSIIVLVMIGFITACSGEDSEVSNINIAIAQSVIEAPEPPGLSKESVRNILVANGAMNLILKSPKFAEFEQDAFDGFNKSRVESFTGESMESDEASLNGNDAESGQGKKYRYRMDRKKSKLFISDFTTEASGIVPNPSVNRARIKKQAMDDLKKLGFKGAGRYHLEVRELMARSLDINDNSILKDEILAYKVRVRDTVYGEKLRGRKMTLSYFRDGSFQKASISWPDISQKGKPMRTTDLGDDIVDLAYEALSDHQLGKLPAEKLKSGMGYELIDGQVRQVLYFKGTFTDEDSGMSQGHMEEVPL
ncbi:MAG: hypothetical protein JXX14_05580 [Deltaproteobacteria bacterium]|nr:hypothetical protein [Deltaproteobacteria bacterium]